MFIYRWLTGQSSDPAPQKEVKADPTPTPQEVADFKKDLVIIANETLNKPVKGPVGDAIRYVEGKDESKLPSLKRLSQKEARELGIAIPDHSKPQGGIAPGRVHHSKRHNKKPAVLQQP